MTRQLVEQLVPMLWTQPVMLVRSAFDFAKWHGLDAVDTERGLGHGYGAPDTIAGLDWYDPVWSRPPCNGVWK